MKTKELLEKYGFRATTKQVKTPKAIEEDDTPIDPLEEIKKAVRTGELGKEKLLFLKRMFHTKPELCRIIQAYLDTKD